MSSFVHTIIWATIHSLRIIMKDDIKEILHAILDSSVSYFCARQDSLCYNALIQGM